MLIVHVYLLQVLRVEQASRQVVLHYLPNVVNASQVTADPTSGALHVTFRMEWEEVWASPALGMATVNCWQGHLPGHTEPQRAFHEEGGCLPLCCCVFVPCSLYMGSFSAFCTSQ